MRNIRRVTVQRYQELYSEHIKAVAIRTIYRWIEEEKLAAEKDPGGHGWLIKVGQDDPLTPYLS